MKIKLKYLYQKYTYLEATTYYTWYDIFACKLLQNAINWNEM